EFFENFHIQEAEKDMLQTATKVSIMVETYDDRSMMIDTVKRVKDPESRVVIVFDDNTDWTSDSSDQSLSSLDYNWIKHEDDLSDVLDENKDVKKQLILPGSEVEAMIVGTPIENHGAVFVYQSLDVIDQTKAETTKIIFLAAGIAIVLTTIFAFFLSTRITAPLIKMREAAFELARGEFSTKVPILTHDEIGELAIAFNRMGRQLKSHINALNQEKEQLSSIVNSMADGVITLNRHGDMIVTNPPSEQFLQDLYLDKNISQENSDQQLPEVLDHLLQKVVSGETEAIYEINLQGRDWVMIMTPLYDNNFVRG